MEDLASKDFSLPSLFIFDYTPIVCFITDCVIKYEGKLLHFFVKILSVSLNSRNRGSQINVSMVEAQIFSIQILNFLMRCFYLS